MERVLVAHKAKPSTVDHIRRRCLVSILALLLAGCAVLFTSSGANDIFGLAGIRLSSDSEIPDEIRTYTQGGPQLFNPDYDPDSPHAVALRAKSGTMGVQDIQTALAGMAASKNPAEDAELKAKRAREEDTIHTSHLFDPAHDPDAPRPRLSFATEEELAENRKANQMKARLKIEAQLAMLTERQEIRKGARTHSEKKKKVPVRIAREKREEHGNPSLKPTFRSISEEVRKSLDGGADPNRIISHELEAEMQYESRVRGSSSSSAGDAIAEAVRINGHP